ncbi:MAG: patatin-like phospholipase family protein [Acidobacteriota bacterium]
MEHKDIVWGLALGSGSARGWAHLGVVRALHEIGIRPRVVTGCSVGAMVGGAWATRQLEVLERWALSLNRRDLVGFLDISLGGSLIKGERVFQLFERYRDLGIEDLPRRFGAVATDLESGEQREFTSGPLLEAVRASMSMPGLLPPVHLDGRWLVDGGLADPIPVSLCRRLGATHVIAVNLNRGSVGAAASRELAADVGEGVEKGEGGRTLRGGLVAVGDRLDVLTQRLRSRFEDTGEVEAPPKAGTKPPSAPGLYDVMIGALHVLQDRLVAYSLERDPPDFELSPQLGGIGMLEVYRAEEAIAEGRRVVEQAAAELLALVSEDLR